MSKMLLVWVAREWKRELRSGDYLNEWSRQHCCLTRKGRGGYARSDKPFCWLLAPCVTFPRGRNLGKPRVSCIWGLERSHSALVTLQIKLHLCIPHFKLCILLFLFLTLFLLLTAGLSFCQKTVYEWEEAAEGGSVGICWMEGMGNVFCLVTGGTCYVLTKIEGEGRLEQPFTVCVQ